MLKTAVKRKKDAILICKLGAGFTPFCLAAARQSTFPKGTAFGGGGKVAGIAQRRPLGGAAERSEAEGVSSPQTSSPSQALPRQLSRRESQGLRLVAEVLSVMRKFPAVLLPLPLRKDFPRSGGRCRAATKGGVWHGVSRDGEGEHPLSRSAALSQKAALQMPFAATTPPVKRRLERPAGRDKREI